MTKLDKIIENNQFFFDMKIINKEIYTANINFLNSIFNNKRLS